MTHGQMIQKYAKTLVALGILGLVGACADNLAPASETHTAKAPANYLLFGSPIVFRVDNSAGITKAIGNHVINIPAGAICDLLTSGYGKTEWDKPCTPLAGSVVITATIFTSPDGEPYIDFQPAMRFAPNKEVMLFFREPRNDGTKEPSVEYCNALLQCYDESITDPSLNVFRIGSSSILGRRVKHFSGFTVQFTEECDGEISPTDDGGWWCETDDRSDGVSMNRRSGYMVASGEDITEVMPEQPTEQGLPPKKVNR